MGRITCHSRWCPIGFPIFQLPNGLPNEQYCKDVAATIASNESSSSYPDLADVACCKLYCGERSQLLQLQCQNMSRTVAMLIWFMVVVLLLFALIQVVCVLWGRGGRYVAKFGGPLFLSFISIVVYATHADKLSGISIDTPLYPVVGAMNVIAFGYYFSSFQYSIGLTYELTAASALVFSMFPIWEILTVDMNTIFLYEGEHRGQVQVIAWLTLAALILSILWVIHSSLYRTVGYRATWITAMQKKSAERGRLLPRLWILAGAAGHPTWRTSTGQSIGLYLTVLSWVIAGSSYNYLQNTCREDLILFHIMLWAPPTILTMAVLATHITICIKDFLNLQENKDKLLQWILWVPCEKYHEAMICYRLGRDTLKVESRIKKYKMALCCGCIGDMDKFLAKMVFFFETFFFQALAFPATILLEVFRWFAIFFLKCTTTVFSRWDQKLQPNLSDKIRAYQVLCEHCLGEQTDRFYKRSVLHGLTKGYIGEDFDMMTTLEDDVVEDICKMLTEEDIDGDVCKMFREHSRKIRLPLLLDNIDPLGFRYLLKHLVAVMDEMEGSHPPPFPGAEDSLSTKSGN